MVIIPNSCVSGNSGTGQEVINISSADWIKMIVTATISGLVGLMVYIVKSELDSQENVKVSARLLISDIEKTQEILKASGNGQGVFMNKLNIIPDWRKEFYTVNRKLNKEEAKVLVNFYFLLDRLNGVQVHYKSVYQSHDYVSSEKTNMAKVFGDLSKQVLEINMEPVLKKLDEIS